MQAADGYASTFKDLVNTRIYPPYLVFNLDETDLFSKKLPSPTFIPQMKKYCEENVLEYKARFVTSG